MRHVVFPRLLFLQTSYGCHSQNVLSGNAAGYCFPEMNCVGVLYICIQSSAIQFSCYHPSNVSSMKASVSISGVFPKYPRLSLINSIQSLEDAAAKAQIISLFPRSFPMHPFLSFPSSAPKLRYNVPLAVYIPRRVKTPGDLLFETFEYIQGR